MALELEVGPVDHSRRVLLEGVQDRSLSHHPRVEALGMGGGQILTIAVEGGEQDQGAETDGRPPPAADEAAGGDREA